MFRFLALSAIAQEDEHFLSSQGQPRLPGRVVPSHAESGWDGGCPDLFDPLPLAQIAGGCPPFIQNALAGGKAHLQKIHRCKRTVSAQCVGAV